METGEGNRTASEGQFIYPIDVFDHCAGLQSYREGCKIACYGVVHVRAGSGERQTRTWERGRVAQTQSTGQDSTNWKGCRVTATFRAGWGPEYFEGGCGPCMTVEVQL